MCGGCHALISTQNTNKTPSCTTKMVNTVLWSQKSVGIKWERETYSPTWRQKIYAKYGRKTSILWNNSWLHHASIVRNIISGTLKRDRRHQTISGPFNWLLRQKPRCQIEIPLQRNDIVYTQWCIIPIIVIFYNSCRRKKFLGDQILTTPVNPMGKSSHSPTSRKI